MASRLPPTDRRLLVVAAVAAFTLYASPAAAQVQSGARSIQLVAIKLPAVAPMQAVSPSADPTSAVEVRLDGECTIRVAVVGSSSERAGGEEVFRGRCRETSPLHGFRLSSVDAAPASEAITLRVTVLSGRGETQRRWTMYVTRPQASVH